MATCQAGEFQPNPCQKKAEMKLADPAGADQILLTVPGAFIASQDDQGIAAFLSRRG